MMPAQRPFSVRARRAALTISLNRLEICATRPGPAEFCREAKSGGDVGVPRGALLGVIAWVALLAGCGQAPEPQQKAGQQEAAVEGPSRNQADEKAWAEALRADSRSEEHTSELQSLRHLVCRLLREKKNSLRRHTTRPTGADHRRGRRADAVDDLPADDGDLYSTTARGQCSLRLRPPHTSTRGRSPA